ncbi:MAG: adenylate/guanylate cyclase domain-containing protein [Leptospiraceae bacterium]|nr:adenylate/guanylate cyclase domain-containing protein [Leptospiraceae bacterium]
MKNKILEFIYKLIGEPKKSSLEHRLFNSVSLVNGIINILGSFATYSLENFIVLFCLNFGTGILFLVMYYFSRFRNIYYVLFWPFNLSILAFLSINWFLNNGSLGGSHYYLIPALVVATILLKNHNVFGLYFFYATLSALLFYLEFNYPHLVTKYANDSERMMDVSGNYIFVQILTGILIFILVQNLNQERKKSEQLLLNILPESIADELKKNDFVEPAHFDSVTVIFCDMVGFTKISETMTASELVKELHIIFSSFDGIMKQYGLEKIKTIGDAYMAVSGLPKETEDHAIRAINATLSLKKFMNEYELKKTQEGKQSFNFRIGMHSGPVAAGIVGTDKFAYDIWGDTVNTASRMESSGLAGEINISESTFALVKDKFPCEYRGKIEAKNKGELEMYLVRA